MRRDKLHVIPVVELLLSTAATSREIELIEKTFDPEETLRLVVLENCYRRGAGDAVLRRAKIWNTLGFLIFEVETWDYEGGRFERLISPLCPIGNARKITCLSHLSLTQLALARTLQTKHKDNEAQIQLGALRTSAHADVEMHLSELALRLPYGADWGSTLTFDFDKAILSRQTEEEIWIEPRFVIDLARTKTSEGSVKLIEYTPKPKLLLTEALSGQPGKMEYRLLTEGQDLILEEQYICELLEQNIIWRTPISINDQRSNSPAGAYLPLRTLYQLLMEQSQWSRWNFYRHPTPSEVTAFERVIHPSGDAGRILYYLGKDLSQIWKDRVTVASKWQAVSVILSAAMIPKKNSVITRRIHIAQTTSNLSRLVRNGGQLMSILLKNSWALGWTKRPVNSAFVRMPFTPLRSPHPELIP